MRGGLLAGATTLALIFAAFGASLAQTKANPLLSGADLLAALHGGGYIIYFRHADTDWSQKDTPGMNFETTSE